MPALKNLNGKRFGRLVVLHSGLMKRCFCRCDCGVEKAVPRAGLMAGKSRSCGCLKDEKHADRLRSHGWYGTPEYSAYRNAKNRCEREEDVRFDQYGGRGIEMRFASFQEFIDEIGPRPSSRYSLDRIDPDGHYEAGNVRWADNKTQARNKHHSTVVEIDGVTKPLADWCEEFDQPYKRVWERMKGGWSAERALATPAQSCTQAATFVQVEAL